MTHEAARLQPDYAGPLLAPDEPPPYRLVNSQGGAAVLIVCDHASNRIPQSLDGLGVPAAALAQHVAYDIGSAAVTRHLARWFDAPAILCEYSRLVVDTNRFPGDPTSRMKVSDGVVVPGNHDISEEQAAQRAEEIFHPFHRAVAAELDRIRRRGEIPMLLSIHSFTPVFAGRDRPWHIGVLWHEDFRLAGRMLNALRADSALCVGENEPYHARKPLGYTMVTHAEAGGLPHLLLEIRQDLIAADDGAERWARVVHTALAPIVGDRSVYRLWERDNA